MRRIQPNHKFRSESFPAGDADLTSAKLQNGFAQWQSVAAGTVGCIGHRISQRYVPEYLHPFVHGAADQMVPVEMTYKNFEACAGPKQIYIVPGAGHGASYVVNPRGYEAMLQDFWEKSDHPEIAKENDNDSLQSPL